MFCHQEIQNKNYRNLQYMKFLFYIINPKIISFDAQLIESDDRYLDIFSNPNDNVRKYVWTYHKSIISSKNLFLSHNNLIPVIDAFD
jgi:hypothetical protein